MSLTDFYAKLLSEIKLTTDGEPDLIANTANVSALLFEHLNKHKPGSPINWAGFYFNKGNQLVLGPFQGKVACIRIKFGRGVCGTTAANRTTTIVPDVHQFPGHIACDSQSNSEIVVPIIKQDKLYGVIDIDSLALNTFNEEDKAGLEEIAKIVAEIFDAAEKNPNALPTAQGH